MQGKYVLTILEDVCNANGKTSEMANKLLETASHYGKLQHYADALKENNAEFQATIDNLNAQLKAIQDQRLTADEISLVSAYRQIVAKKIGEKDKEINELRAELTDVKTACELKIKRVQEVLGE